MNNYPKINIGIGGFVISKKSEILLIRRKTHPFTWTIPSGYMQKSESLFETIKREVKEETGIKIRPIGIVAIRQRITKKEGNNLWLIVISDYQSGKLIPDKSEVSEVKFINTDDVLREKITPVTKQLVRLFLKNKLQIIKLQKSLNRKNYKFFV